MPDTTPQSNSFTVFKDARGQWRWLARTTTAFEDRDQEVLSLKALEADADRADADKLYGPLRWWHIGTPDSQHPTAPWGPGLDLGWCDFNAVSGKTLIESGTFKTEAIARWAATNADQLGLSPGFFHPRTEPDQDGVFHHIRRFERSIAPKDRVSNPFTAFAVTQHRTYKETTPVRPEQIITLLDMGLDQATLKATLEQLARTEKTAEAAGVRTKTTPAADPPNPALDQIAALEQQLAALKTAMETPAPVTPEPVVAEPVPADPLASFSALLDSKLAPVLSAVTAMAGGATATATKTAQLEQATASELTTLKAQQVALLTRIAQLEGDQTNLQRGHIASQSQSTVTNKAAELAVESQPQPMNQIDEVLAWTRQAIPQALGTVPPSVQ